MSAIQDFKQFSDLTDAELDAYNFEIDDPRDIHNLTFDIPQGVTLVGILHHYRFQNEKLKCAECQRAAHNRGAVVLLSNGQHCLLGSTCGPRQFPSEWHDAYSKFERALEVREFRDRNGQLIETVPKLLIAASHLRAPYEELKQFTVSVKAELGDALLRNLVPALRNGDGNLYRDVRISSVVQDAFDTAQSNGTNRRAAAEFRRELVGRLSGSELFLANSCKRELETGIAELRKVQQSLETLKTPLPKQKRAHELYNQAIRRIKETVPVYEAARSFATKSNARTLRSWAAEYDFDLSMQIKGDQLRLRCSGHRYQSIPISGMPPIDRLRQNIGIAGARLLPSQ